MIRLVGDHRRWSAIAALLAVLLMWSAGPAMAQDSAAGRPNATQTANINAALAQLRADIAQATRINADVKSRQQREKNAEEIAVFQRVLDNLAGKLERGELHPVNNLASGKDAAAGTVTGFVYEDEKAGVISAGSPTGVYCPDNAYILVGTPQNVERYIGISGKDATEARTLRDQYVSGGNVRRIACPRSHMVFDSGLLDPGAGAPLDPETADGWCRTRELLDVLAHEKFHEIVIEDAVNQLRKRNDFQSQPANARAARERAVFQQGASHDNHALVYNWQIKTNQLVLALIAKRLKEINDKTGAAAGAGEADALKAKKECIERRIEDLKRYARRATGGSHFHSAVIREPQECVATTYHVSQTVVEEGETLVPLQDRTITEEPIPVEDGDGIPECHEAEGASTTYISVPPPGELPGPEGETPKDGEPPPAKTVVEDSPAQNEVPEEDIDLGLVKAVTSVVTVALSRAGSGEPVQGATVKLVEEAPDLPVAGFGGARSTNAAEYLTDQTAATTGADGVMRIASDAKIELLPVDDDIYQGTTVLDVGDTDADEGGAIRVHHQIKAAEPMRQMVIAAKGAQGARATALAYPAALDSQWRGKICIRQSFVIGGTSLHVIRLPEEVVERFKNLVTQTEGVLFVEDDPCRQKELAFRGASNSKVFLDPAFTGVWNDESTAVFE